MNTIFYFDGAGNTPLTPQRTRHNSFRVSPLEKS